MRHKYLALAVVEVEEETLTEPPASPMPTSPTFDRQDAVATYLTCVLHRGVQEEDDRDRVCDVRVYEIGECLGRDSEAHAPVIAIGHREGPTLVYWCKTCGAIKRNGKWENPEIRIDRNDQENT